MGDTAGTSTRRSRLTMVGLAVVSAAGAFGVGAGAVPAAADHERPATAYVTNNGDDTVTPIDTANPTAGTPIPVGGGPDDIAITPDGATAYVTDRGDDTVTPIDLATNTPGTPITVGEFPRGIAITPDGATAYVTNTLDGTVTPINLATNTAGTPITVGNRPTGIAITPNGATAYVTNNMDGTVTPINLATNTAGTPITVGNGPWGAAVTPDGVTAYIANTDDDTVFPIATATNTSGIRIAVGDGPIGIAITPNGATAYVANSFGHSVTPITTGTNTPGAPIPVGSIFTAGTDPVGVAVTPDGATAYVANSGSDNVARINTATNAPFLANIAVGDAPLHVAMRPPCSAHPFSDVPLWIATSVTYHYCGGTMTGYPDNTFRDTLAITRAQVARLLYRAAGSPDVSALPAAPWPDTPAWIAEAAKWVAHNSYMTGYPDNTFRPDIPITRGQVTRAAYRVDGSPAAPPHPFTDVPAWLTDAVNWAAEDPDGGGPIPPRMAGYPDNTFRDTLDITRGQTARLICRANVTPADRAAHC